MPNFDEFEKLFGNANFLFKPPIDGLFGEKIYYGMKEGYDPLGKYFGIENSISEDNPAYQMVKAYYESKYPGRKYEDSIGYNNNVDLGQGEIPKLTEEDDANLKAMGATYGLMALGDIEKQAKIKEALNPLSNTNIRQSTSVGDLGYFADGGIAGAGIEYQTEGGEVLVMPDLSIIETAASKPHSKMAKDRVTDFLPIGTYVGSKRVKINKKDADKIVIATSSVKYKEGEKPKEPKKYTLADIFGNKKSLSVADAIKRVKNKFPVIDKKGDVSVEQTNSLNKMARIPYLQAIIGLAESNKLLENSKKKSNEPNYAKEGGIVTKKDVLKAPKGDTSGDNSDLLKIVGLSAIGGLSSLGTIWNLVQSQKAAKEATKDVNAAYNKSADLLNTGTAIGLGSILGQDSNVTPVDYSNVLSEVESMPGEVPYSVVRGISNNNEVSMRSMARDVFDNSSSYSEAIAGLQKLASGNVSAKNKAMLNLAQVNSSIEQNKSKTLANIKEKIALTNSNAANQTRVNRNKQLSSIGNLGIGQTNAMSNLEMSKANALMAIKMSATKNEQEAVSSMLGNLTSLIPVIGSMGFKKKDNMNLSSSNRIIQEPIKIPGIDIPGIVPSKERVIPQPQLPSSDRIIQEPTKIPGIDIPGIVPSKENEKSKPEKTPDEIIQDENKRAINDDIATYKDLYDIEISKGRTVKEAIKAVSDELDAIYPDDESAYCCKEEYDAVMKYKKQIIDEIIK